MSVAAESIHIGTAGTSGLRKPGGHAQCRVCVCMCANQWTGLATALLSKSTARLLLTSTNLLSPIDALQGLLAALLC